MMTAPWYKDAIFYELYIRAFKDSNGDGHGDLPGVIEKLDYLKSLGVDCIWLLPFYPSPLKDDGYDIADYYNIITDYGTLADFERLIAEAHQRGLRVITDLVVNHTSDQHPWFVESRSSRDNPKRDWYVMRFWLEKGIDGFRVDAVPYLIEREGTNCENLPETHAYLKRMRQFADEHFPEAVLLCEANQPPEDVVAYFGDDDEFHMGFHFPVMPRIFMALRRGEAASIRAIMERTPPIPDRAQWCTFLRNHDELTLEMVTEEERQWMWQEYAPDPRMRLNLGIRRRLAPLLDNDSEKIMLANRILFSLPGAPIIYYGDEIGMGDNIWLPDRNGVRTPMQWDDSANAGFSAASPDRLYAPVIDDPVYGYQRVNVAQQVNDPESMFSRLRDLIALRKQYRAFSHGTLRFLDSDNPAILAFVREHGDETFVVVHNLRGEMQHATLDLSAFAGKHLTDVLNPAARPDPIGVGAYPVDLPSYGSQWLRIEG
jgi:maltose alpha-D-glucosyltransferase/alpha-amylase